MSAAASPAPSSSDAALNACSLVTPAELSARLGGAWSAGVGEGLCFFGAQDDSAVTLIITDLGDDAATAFAVNSAAQADHEVYGVGDAAYWSEAFGGLIVLVGHTELDVAMNDAAGALVETKSIAVARIASARIP